MNKLLQKPIRELQLDVKTERLEHQVLVMQKRVSPLPKVFGLFIYQHVRVLHRNPTTCNHKLPHLPAIFIHFGREKD